MWFTLPGLRKHWNRNKNELCVDEDTGGVWWPELSKEAAANGIDDAVAAYWGWVKSCQGVRKGARLGFPQFNKKQRSRESYRIGTGTIKLVDRRHVQLPRLGAVRLGENARRLDRLIGKDTAVVKAATVSVHAGKCYVSLQVDVLRPQQHHKPTLPVSKIGIDLGTRRFAVVADSDGVVLERVVHPALLKTAQQNLRRLLRSYARSRLANLDGSNRQTILKQKISCTHADVKAQRFDFMHKLTTRLAKTHGTDAVDDLNVNGRPERERHAHQRRQCWRQTPTTGLG